MKPAKLALIALLVLLPLSGCALFRHRQKEGAAAPARPRLIGSISYVNEAMGFVLVDTGSLYLPGPGKALKVLRQGEEAAILIVTPERKRPFVSADVVKGEPRTGDDVYE